MVAALVRWILGVCAMLQMTGALRPLSRRGVCVAGAASVLAPAAARAAPSLLSSLQGPVQDAVAPGHWIGQFAGLNSRTETWEFAGAAPGEISAAIVGVLEELTPERRRKLLIPEFKITRADAKHVHVLTWTKSEWLDSFDVELSETERGGTSAKASFYATGFFPTSLLRFQYSKTPACRRKYRYGQSDGVALRNSISDAQRGYFLMNFWFCGFFWATPSTSSPTLSAMTCGKMSMQETPNNLHRTKMTSVGKTDHDPCICLYGSEKRRVV